MSGPVDLSLVLADWPEDQAGLRRAFQELTAFAQDLPGARGSLVSRAGVSHSFRADLATPGKNRARPVFMLVDVVVSPADPWFLSVCFYEDEVTDPEELGNPIPQGLYDETGYCFDVDEYDSDLMAYLENRGREAHGAASIIRTDSVM